jgi:hypothetical protein
MDGQHQFGGTQAGFICLNGSRTVRFGGKCHNFSAVSSQPKKEAFGDAYIEDLYLAIDLMTQ